MPTPGVKVSTLAAGMRAGADSIDDMGLLGAVADPALGRAAGEVVLDPMAGEDLHRAVVSGKWDGYGTSRRDRASSSWVPGP